MIISLTCLGHGIAMRLRSSHLPWHYQGLLALPIHCWTHDIAETKTQIENVEASIFVSQVEQTAAAGQTEQPAAEVGASSGKQTASAPEQKKQPPDEAKDEAVDTAKPKRRRVTHEVEELPSDDDQPTLKLKVSPSSAPKPKPSIAIIRPTSVPYNAVRGRQEALWYANQTTPAPANTGKYSTDVMTVLRPGERRYKTSEDGRDVAASSSQGSRALQGSSM